jgi:hypothetical protein
LDKFLAKLLISAFELRIIVSIVVFAIFCSKINVGWRINDQFVIDHKVSDLGIYEEIELIIVCFSLILYLGRRLKTIISLRFFIELTISKESNFFGGVFLDIMRKSRFFIEFQIQHLVVFSFSIIFIGWRIVLGGTIFIGTSGLGDFFSLL